MYYMLTIDWYSGVAMIILTIIAINVIVSINLTVDSFCCVL